MTDLARNPWLLAGGLLSLVAALAHLACILGGPEWYRAMGAGERMARLVAAGRIGPVVITLAIAMILAGFSAYALSGAGMLPRLPLLRPALIGVTAVYLARGLILFWPAALKRPDLSPSFIFWSSVIVLTFGLIHLVGLWRGWADLRGV
ncbi:hypothetical protein [Sphingomonas sp. PB4P5]|uniref:hypothetical protein n=1 Tax=Parasphingomonas puruogangriensis TaxID=3096155 RepID=UPI002FC5EFAE